MDTRLKIKEVRRFFSNLKKDYKSSTIPTKKQKRQAYFRTLKQSFYSVWNAITAPFIYPIWYMFKKTITTKVYQGTSWQEIGQMIKDNKTEQVKTKLKSNGKFLYWLWTYGDLNDPLGNGELQSWAKKNNFWTRFCENAIRNPRFTINFMEFRTGNIVRVVPVIDTRNFNLMHKSQGIGDSPDGIYFKWMLDENGRWGFIYEDNNVENIFYYGNVGLLYKDIGFNGRFETGYRQTDSSYTK